jgi:hypothetical protein
MAVDGAERVPEGHLDMLASAGLAREALFLLVFASRPTIKESLAALLTAARA